MPSVYTIEGASMPRRRKKRRKSSGLGGALTAQQKKFAAAAKACKGGTQLEYRACMKQELRR